MKDGIEDTMNKEVVFVTLSESEGSQILRLRLRMTSGAGLIIVSVILSGSEGSNKAKHLNTEILHGVYPELSRRVQNDKRKHVICACIRLVQD
jgi:hypothetical protein